MSVDLVEQVIERVRAGGFGVFTARTHWPQLSDIVPTPVPRAALAAATLPTGGQLPETWRAWLAFDGAWLMRLGWFARLDPLEWTPQPLATIVGEQVGAVWANFYPSRTFATCFLLAGGSDSRRILSISDAPDRAGEHPVLWIDVDDQPAMGVLHPGLDVYLGWAAGVVDEPRGRNTTYTDTARLPIARARNAHHVARLLRGKWEVEFPVSLDDTTVTKPSKPKRFGSSLERTSNTKPMPRAKAKPKVKPKVQAKAKR
jgi:hypothetical protein